MILLSADILERTLRNVRDKPENVKEAYGKNMLT